MPMLSIAWRAQRAISGDAWIWNAIVVVDGDTSMSTRFSMLHELGFTADEVMTIEELCSKRGVRHSDLLRSAISLHRRWHLGQVVVMTQERYKQLIGETK